MANTEWLDRKDVHLIGKSIVVLQINICETSDTETIFATLQLEVSSPRSEADTIKAVKKHQEVT